MFFLCPGWLSIWIVLRQNMSLAFFLSSVVSHLFFFFKQKTAYEIQVSLEFRRVLFRSTFVRVSPGFRWLVPRAPIVYTRCVEAAATQRAPAVETDARLEVIAGPLSGKTFPKIGRASCRERG